MKPISRTLALIFLLAALVGTGAPSGPAQGQPPVMIYQARFVDPPLAQVVDGRLHLTVAITLHSSGLIPSIDSVQWNSGGGVDVRVSARWPAGAILPAFTEETLPLTIDNLPPGSYSLRLLSHTLLDQVPVTVPAQRRDRFPLEIRVWPPDPTPYEPMWLLVDRWNQCHALQPILQGAQWLGELRTLAQPCAAPVTAPRLAAVLLAGQSAPASVGLRTADGLNALRLRRSPWQVSLRRTSRFSGAWYDPAQSGHGVTLEIVDGGTVLLQWLTFDTAGNPFWIVAAGPNDGDPVVLQAHTASGGRFPPQFDPTLVQRQAWGTIRLDNWSCASARMRWEGRMPHFVSGSMALRRLAADYGGCGQPPPESALEPAWYQGPGSYFRLPDPG